MDGTVPRVPEVDAALIDIDGVLTVGWQVIPGTPTAVERVRDAGLQVVFLTNTTTRSRASIATTLATSGVQVRPDEILTAPVATAAYLRRHHSGARCYLLNSGDISADLPGVSLTSDPDQADVVVLGGAGPEFDSESLNRVFQLVIAGAPLVAMHRSLMWRTESGFQLDTGAFLLAVEEAAGVRSVVVGKPDPAFSTTLDEAAHAQKTLLPAMQSVRAAADELETLVADDLWPLATSQEMLFIL